MGMTEREAAIQRLAEDMEREIQLRRFDKNLTFLEVAIICARIAIEQGVVPACNATDRSWRKQVTSGAWGGPSAIPWDAVTRAGEKP